RVVELPGADRATGPRRAGAERAARPADLLLLGRALTAISVDGAHVALTLAAALGEALSPEDQAFLAAHPPRRMAPDETYAAALDDADVALLADGADGPLAELGTALGEAAALLWPDPAKAVGGAAAPGGRRQSTIRSPGSWPRRRCCSRPTPPARPTRRWCARRRRRSSWGRASSARRWATSSSASSWRAPRS